MSIETINVQMEWFALRAAVEALITGDAKLVKDEEDYVTEIVWDEPICDPFADRLVGIARCDETMGWKPVIEAGIPKDSPTIEDADGNVVGYAITPEGWDEDC